MIELLDHYSESVAIQIYDVFQLSYEVEASLVGVKDFPPLRRNASHIQSSSSQFLGQRIGVDLSAVVEYTQIGFSESKRWKTADGIEKVRLMCRNTT